ncbi:MAG: hypothetical protein AAGA66_19510 [Bacteroidota bacterium]
MEKLHDPDVGISIQEPVLLGSGVREVPEGVPLHWETCNESYLSTLNGTVVWSGRGYSGSNAGSVHPYDGLPKLFGIDLENGQARFRSRFIRNKLYDETIKHEALPPLIQVSENATGRSRWHLRHSLRYLPLFLDRPVAATTGALDVQKIHDRVLVNYDGPSYAVEIDLDSFETVRELHPGSGLGMIPVRPLTFVAMTTGITTM